MTHRPPSFDRYRPAVARWCLALLLLVAAAGRLAAHPAYLNAALATVERDGRFRVTVRFDVLAFALNDASERMPDPPMNALLDGPPADLERHMIEACEHFARHFRLAADGREVAVTDLQFPTVDDVLAWKAANHQPRLPVLLEAAASGRLPAGTTRVAFAFPEIIGTIVLTVERPGEEAWTEPIQAGATSRELVVTLTGAVQAELPARLTALVGPGPTPPVRLWVLDEHRYGLLPVIHRVWGRRGVRVHAPDATRYKWSYLYEALEVDGTYACELLLTPVIDRDVHALFLQQIAATDPAALHVVIADQAGFHLPAGDARIPANLRLLPLLPNCPELNPVERFGGQLKAAVANRLYLNLRKLEDHLIAAARPWSTPAAVSRLIHTWLADKVSHGAPA